MDLSVLIVSWNTRALTLECLGHVWAALHAEGAGPLEAEVVLVDNGSSDASASACRERYPEIDVVALTENLGFARANNAGLARCRGRHVLLLNTDVRLERETLDRCRALLDEQPQVGIVGPELLHPDGRVQNSIHAFPSLATELLPIALLEVLLPGRYPSKRSPRDAPHEVEAVQGAALLARRHFVDEVGPLCEDYFFFLEETDWCWRARAAGWQVVHIPGAGLVHELGASSKRPYPGPTAIEYHRSLYRFLRERRGRVTWAVCAVARLGRAAFGAVVLSLAGVVSARQRRRAVGRRAVLLWHLRGCPEGAGLADAVPLDA